MSTNLTDLENLAYYRVLRPAQVVELIGLSRATIYRLMGEDGFLRSVEIGKGAIGWYAGEVLRWLATRPRREKGLRDAPNHGAQWKAPKLESDIASGTTSNQRPC